MSELFRTSVFFFSDTQNNQYYIKKKWSEAHIYIYKYVKGCFSFFFLFWFSDVRTLAFVAALIIWRPHARHNGGPMGFFGVYLCLCMSVADKLSNLNPNVTRGLRVPQWRLEWLSFAPFPKGVFSVKVYIHVKMVLFLWGTWRDFIREIWLYRVAWSVDM